MLVAEHLVVDEVVEQGHEQRDRAPNSGDEPSIDLSGLGQLEVKVD